MSGTCHNPECGRPLPPQPNGGRRRKWCSERCRKRARYYGACEVCGAPAAYGSRDRNAAARCRACAVEARVKWTSERILDAIRAHYAEHGEPPRADEWRLNGRGDAHPPTTAVQRRFGTWNAAIRAAGVPTNKPGPKPRRKEYA